MALIALPQAAMAAEYEVRIYPGFFPTTTYILSGDTVRFRNMTPDTATVSADDESWTTGPLAQDDEYVLPINSGTARYFTLEEDTEKTGSFSFAPPPTQ